MGDECRLIDGKGKVVALGPQDLLERYLKHRAPDGDYAIKGPGIDVTFYRDGGVVYPSGGLIGEGKVPPRSLAECKRFFTQQADQ